MNKVFSKINNYIKKISSFSSEIRNYHLAAYAASMAFFIFLSLVPLLLLICNIIPYTPINKETVIYFMTQFIPVTFVNIVTSVINEIYTISSSMLPISAIIMIWSAAKGIVSLMYALNNINRTPESRPYLITRAIACFYTVIFLLGIVLSLLLIVFGSTIKTFLLIHFPMLDGILNLIMKLRILVVWAFLTLTFALIYAYVPVQRKHLVNQLPGALCCAIAWTAFSFLFSIYVTSFNSFGIYGSLSLIVIMLFWLYACMNIILYCAYINIFFEKLFNKER